MQNSLSKTSREAQAVVVESMTLDSVSEVADIHLDAFKGYMNAALGKGYVRAFLTWFCEADDGIAFVARYDGCAVGYVVGAPVGYNNRLTRSLAWGVATSIAVRPWLVLRSDIRTALTARMKMLGGAGGNRVAGTPVSELSVPTVSLVGIGVAASAQGCGVGGALMKAFETAAADRGAKMMRLTVYRDNAAACRVYERAGWRSSGGTQSRTVCFEKTIDDLQENH